VAGTVEEALHHLAAFGDEGRVLAGGTDIMVQRLRGTWGDHPLVYIEGIGELRGVTLERAVTIGAATTHLGLWQSAVVVENLPALADAARTVGGWQTQAVGTIGGNVCNASPAADLLPPLLVSDARAMLANAERERTVPVRDFVLGRGATALEAGELVVGFAADPASASTGEAYAKLGRRSAMDVAIAGVAVRLDIDDGVARDVRVAAAAVGPSVFRASEAEARLEGSALDDAALAEAGRALSDAATPIDDARASARYRRAVLPGVLERAVRTAIGRAGRDSA